MISECRVPALHLTVKPCSNDVDAAAAPWPSTPVEGDAAAAVAVPIPVQSRLSMTLLTA